MTRPRTILGSDGKTETPSIPKKIALPRPSTQSSPAAQTSQTLDKSAKESWVRSAGISLAESAGEALADNAKDSSAERPKKDLATAKFADKPAPSPRPRPNRKERIQLNSDRQTKGSEDPIKLHNRFSPVS